MATIDDNIKPLPVKDFLSEGKYVIPIYQRNYDWGEREALQLLEDISDYAKNANSPNYYIGSVVVFVRSVNGESYFETIDGQQRLTTLTILASLLKRLNVAGWFKEPNLSYDHRKEADDALVMLQRDENSFVPQSAHNIIDVYGLFKKNLPQVLETKGLSLQDFADYLSSKVMILRIPVPQDTQLNHYFEIMNTRGEQLEKHEVLKAVLMSNLSPNEHKLFHLIWEACSDMSSYVQMNFTVGQRKLIFDAEWKKLQFKDFDSLRDALENVDNNNTEYDEDCTPHTLNNLFEDAKNNKPHSLPRDGSQEEGEQDRFGSIINFPNFLLQVLKVCYHKSDFYREEVDTGIRLDDKALIPIFENVLKSMSEETEKKRFVKFFIMELLFLRVQYDSYVIKREHINGTESWSLKTIRKYDNNKANYVNTFSTDNSEDENYLGKEIRMLEAMFHVSAPTQIYKHWLNAVLLCIYKKEPIESSFLRDRLFNLACSFMLDVYLGQENFDFEDIIYGRKDFLPHNSVSEIDWRKIDCGCNVPNFVLNFYDFITWRGNKKNYPKFEFSYRTSVEHFYPQNPMPGYDNLKDRGLDKFGNLCLISRGMNSKFSNNMPKAKLDNFGLMEEVRKGLSLKLLEMMDIVKSEGGWGETEIENFDNIAKNRILEALKQIG